MRELKAIGYISEPHAAIAWRALRDQLQPGEYGLLLGTAHPAKFKESVEEILQETLPLPKELVICADLPLLSHTTCRRISPRCVSRDDGPSRATISAT